MATDRHGPRNAVRPRGDVDPTEPTDPTTDKPYKAIVVAVLGAIVTVLQAVGIPVDPALVNAVQTVVLFVLVYAVSNKPKAAR